MATTVTYKGETLTTATNQTKTLLTQGKYMEDDVTITDTSPTFTTQTKSRTFSALPGGTQTSTIRPDAGYDGLTQVEVTINAIPTAGKQTVLVNAPSPTLSFDSATGVVTGTTVAQTVDRYPIISDGYIKTNSTVRIKDNGGASDTYQVPTQAAQTITPSSVQQTIAAGVYLTGTQTIDAVPSGTEGTPTATKGAVSNHSVSVTPSVTNTTGYITGGTKTGTAVSVSASELVSGSETKTQNGTYDVTNLAKLVVNVQGGGNPVKTKTGTFTGNGTRTIDVACDFEPDLVYVTSDPGTTASSGTVAFIIARDMMAASRYRNNSTTNSHYAVTPCVNLNTSGSSYSWRATYANSKVTLYSYSNNARALLTNGRTYTYQFVKWTT